MKTYLLFTFFFLSTALSAQIIYVDQDATGQNDGSQLDQRLHRPE
jgi:hypothetical protein